MRRPTVEAEHGPALSPGEQRVLADGEQELRTDDTDDRPRRIVARRRGG